MFCIESKNFWQYGGSFIIVYVFIVLCCSLTRFVQSVLNLSFSYNVTSIPVQQFLNICAGMSSPWQCLLQMFSACTD